MRSVAESGTTVVAVCSEAPDDTVAVATGDVAATEEVAATEGVMATQDVATEGKGRDDALAETGRS